MRNERSLRNHLVYSLHFTDTKTEALGTCCALPRVHDLGLRDGAWPWTLISVVSPSQQNGQGEGLAQQPGPKKAP